MTILGRVKVIVESISIQTFRTSSRGLIRIVNESISISLSLSKLLQDGAVRVIKTFGIHSRSKTVGTHDRSQSTNTYKRDKDIGC
jgi:hypothetical protein